MRGAKGEDRPYEGTLETIVFRDFVERGLAVPVSEFFHSLLQFWGDPTSPFDPTINFAPFHIHALV